MTYHLRVLHCDLSIALLLLHLTLRGAGFPLKSPLQLQVVASSSLLLVALLLHLCLAPERQACDRSLLQTLLVRIQL